MQLRNAVEPFGEVNVNSLANRNRQVTATILMEPHKEGTQTGVAIDGSGSMREQFAVRPGQGASPVCAAARRICPYLARKIDSDGRTTVIYWATGPSGAQVQEIADFSADEAESYAYGPPASFGGGTSLLPAVKFFEEKFRDAAWGFYVFITDGELSDLQAVKSYSTELARKVAAGTRNPIKFLLVGVGPNVNEAQMTELDDLDTGPEIDLWDHKLAASLDVIERIFAEVVDKNAIVAERGRILGQDGRLIQEYAMGLPAFLSFEVSPQDEWFALDVNGRRFFQALADGVSAPPATIGGGGEQTVQALDEAAVDMAATDLS